LIINILNTFRLWWFWHCIHIVFHTHVKIEINYYFIRYKRKEFADKSFSYVLFGNVEMSRFSFLSSGTLNIQCIGIPMNMRLHMRSSSAGSLSLYLLIQLGSLFSRMFSHKWAGSVFWAPAHWIFNVSAYLWDCIWEAVRSALYLLIQL